MSLIGPHYVIETEPGAIVVKFTQRPSVAAYAAVRAHGFKKVDKLTFRRKDNHDGRCAADYLVKRLGELYGL